MNDLIKAHHSFDQSLQDLLEKAVEMGCLVAEVERVIAASREVYRILNQRAEEVLR